MTRMLLGIMVSMLLLTATCRPALGDPYELTAGSPIWVHLADGEVAPDQFQEMRLFWPFVGNAGDQVPQTLKIALYAPADRGWVPPPYDQSQYLNVNLSYFRLRDVLFKISVEGNQHLHLDDTIKGAWYDLLKDVADSSFFSAEFGFGFFNYNPGGLAVFIPGKIHGTEPSISEALLYWSATINSEDYPFKEFSEPIQFVSDFRQPVPIPMTLLLLGSSLAALAGFRKKIIR